MLPNDSGFADQREAQKNTPGIFPVLGAFFLDIGLFAGLWFVGMIIATLFWTVNEYISNAGQIKNPEPGSIALLLISVPTLYTAILAVWALRGRNLKLKQIAITPKNLFLGALAAGFSLFLVTTACTYLLDAAGLSLQPSNQAILEDIGKQTPVLVGLFAILVAPVFEELFFRKQIFARFVNGGYAITGYAISSLLFALSHEPVPSQGLGRWLIMLGIYSGMGAVFARVYRTSGKLWPAMLAHASNNLFAMLALLAGTAMS